MWQKNLLVDIVSLKHQKRFNFLNVVFLMRFV
jgi:hypothetical protein